jgi:hypothetical protein
MVNTELTQEGGDPVSIADRAPCASVPAAVTRQTPGPPRDPLEAERKEKERIRMRQANLLTHLKSTAKSVIFPDSSAAASPEYRSFARLVEEHYVPKIFEGRDGESRIDWGCLITKEERADLERDVDIKAAQLFTPEHRWHDQLNGPLFERVHSGFEMTGILQEKLDSLWPGRNLRKDIRKLWARDGSLGRGSRCVRDMLREMLLDFVDRAADKVAARTQPFPMAEYPFSKSFSKTRIEEILRANHYDHLAHFLSGTARRTCGTPTQFAVWATPVLVSNGTGCRFKLCEQFVSEFAGCAECTLATLAPDMPISTTSPIVLTDKCKDSFRSWEAKGEGFRCERYKNMEGRSFEQITEVNNPVVVIRGTESPRPYSLSDFLYDMDIGYIEFR